MLVYTLKGLKGYFRAVNNFQHCIFIQWNCTKNCQKCNIEKFNQDTRPQLLENVRAIPEFSTINSKKICILIQETEV